MIIKGVELKGFAEFRKKIEQAARKGAVQNQELNVGVLGKAGSELVMIAAVNEYGNEHVPSRPFLRTSLRDPKLAQFVASQAAAYYKGAIPYVTALNKIGAYAASLIQRTIASNIQPANAPSTIKAKGSSRTLIDTGRLRQSISWELVSK